MIASRSSCFLFIKFAIEDDENDARIKMCRSMKLRWNSLYFELSQRSNACTHTLAHTERRKAANEVNENRLFASIRFAVSRLNRNRHHVMLKWFQSKWKSIGRVNKKPKLHWTWSIQAKEGNEENCAFATSTWHLPKIKLICSSILTRLRSLALASNWIEKKTERKGEKNLWIRFNERRNKVALSTLIYDDYFWWLPTHETLERSSRTHKRNSLIGGDANCCRCHRFNCQIQFHLSTQNDTKNTIAETMRSSFGSLKLNPRIHTLRVAFRQQQKLSETKMNSAKFMRNSFLSIGDSQRNHFHQFRSFSWLLSLRGLHCASRATTEIQHLISNEIFEPHTATADTKLSF